MINALMPVKWTSAPLSVPMAVPASRPSRTAVGTAIPFCIHFAAKIAERDKIAPTERSIAPAAMINVMPMASSNRKELASRTFVKFLPAKNRPVRSCKNRPIARQKPMSSHSAPWRCKNCFMPVPPAPAAKSAGAALPVKIPLPKYLQCTAQPASRKSGPQGQRPGKYHG